MQEYQRKRNKFLCKGLRVSQPVDLLPPDKYYFLGNIRYNQDGVLEARPGLTSYLDIDGAASDPIHSINRLNNPVDGNFTYLVGAGAHLYSTFLVTGATNATPIVVTSDRVHRLTTGDRVVVAGVGGNTAANGTWLVTVLSSTTFSLDTSVGNGAYTSGGRVSARRDTGYSGNPLSFLPHQPARSPEPWAYVGDSSRLRKINSSGLDYGWGIAPYNAAPTAELAANTYKTVSDFEATTESAVAWTNGGTAGAISTPARLSAIGVTYVLYDTGSTGWASVVPASFSENFQPGMFIITGVTAAETVVVDSVYDPVVSTTVQSVSYDSGSTGLCTVQLVLAAGGVMRNAFIRNTTRSQNVRVLSVTPGPNNTVSIRVNTGGTTWAAADNITGHRSFRAYFANTHDATTTLSSNHFRTSVAVGTGFVSHVLGRDLSNTGARALTPEDEMHISIRVDDLSRLTEGRIFLDVDGSTNDFTRNYYVYSFRPNDLTPALAGTSTFLPIQQQIIQRTEIAEGYYGIHTLADGTIVAPVRPNPIYDRYRDRPDIDPFIRDLPTFLPPDQTVPGQAQWTELRFKIGALERVGSDTSRTLKDVAAIRVQFTATNTIQCDIDAWWVGGTYGLEVEETEDPYLYVAVPRSTLTGAMGNPSPPMRSGVLPQRQAVNLSVAQHTDPQVDVIDFYRTGGALLEWHYVGTADNDASPNFTDEYSEDVIKFNPLLEFDNFQPFPIVDIPHSGTQCSVVGSTVTKTTGDDFDTSWARGSVIIIDGIACTLYASPTSTTRLEINESIGTKTNVGYSLPSPTKLAQNLAAVFGPYTLGDGGVFIFGVKDGYLYWTKQGNPDSAPDINSLRVTSGSEALVNGCVYDGVPYVFSDRRMYKVTPIPTNDGSVTFQVSEIAHSIGLWSKWGITVGDRIYFVGEDGIYQSDGGIPRSLTHEDLYPLFPHEGMAGSSANNIPAPDFSQGTALRLSQCGPQVYFDYAGVGGRRTLVYDFRIGGWIFDDYADDISLHASGDGAGVYEVLCGSALGVLYTLGGATDSGSPILCSVTTGADDAGDFRAKKQYGDFMLDMYRSPGAGAGTVSVTYHYNGIGVGTSEATQSITSGTARQLYLKEAAAGAGTAHHRSVAVEASWSATTSFSPQLFGWEYTYLVRPEDIQLRPTDWTDAGFSGRKLVKAVTIDADTYNVAKTLGIEYDGGVSAGTIAITHNGRTRATHELASPIQAHLLRLKPQGTTDWALYGAEFLYDRQPELVTMPTEWTDAGRAGLKFVQGMRIHCNTYGLPVLGNVLYDQGQSGAAVVVTANGESVVAVEFAPFEAHVLRFLPASDIQIFGIEWIYEPAPDYASYWQTQGTSHGCAGFHFIRDVYVALKSTGDVTLTISVDNVAYNYVISSTGGVYKKVYVPVQATKGKVYSYLLQSATADFQLFRNDCEVRVQEVSPSSQPKIVNPFGDFHNKIGATI
jgi:hypothetical protein